VKYRYTKFTGTDLDDLDLEDLVSKLSDLLLSSGFGNPHGMDDEERTIAGAARTRFSRAVQRRRAAGGDDRAAAGDPADGDQADARSKLEEPHSADHRAHGG